MLHPEPLVVDLSCHKRFMRLNPPTFAGTKNFIKAERWLKTIEKVFRVLSVTTKQKVILVMHILIGEADRW